MYAAAAQRRRMEKEKSYIVSVTLAWRSDIGGRVHGREEGFRRSKKAQSTKKRTLKNKQTKTKRQSKD